MKELKNIEKDLVKEGLVVVDFFGTWCGPCMNLKPIVEKLAEEYKDKVNVYGCDVDECSDMVMEYGIRNVPTLLFLKDGEIQNRLVGSHQEKTIKDAIDLLISENN